MLKMETTKADGQKVRHKCTQTFMKVWSQDCTCEKGRETDGRAHMLNPPSGDRRNNDHRADRHVSVSQQEGRRLLHSSQTRRGCWTQNYYTRRFCFQGSQEAFAVIIFADRKKYWRDREKDPEKENETSHTLHRKKQKFQFKEDREYDSSIQTSSVCSENLSESVYVCGCVCMCVFFCAPSHCVCVCVIRL